jgi:hypothetical protein
MSMPSRPLRASNAAALAAKRSRAAAVSAASENPSAPQPPTETRIFRRGLRSFSECSRASVAAASGWSSAISPATTCANA